jgi:uncharacterized Fe-S cluster-containing protein
MSKMSSKVFDVQEDILELLDSGKTISEIEEIIEEAHGSMWVHVVEEVVNYND